MAKLTREEVERIVKEAPGRRKLPNLREVDLSNMDLSEADLGVANLFGANLSEVNLDLGLGLVTIELPDEGEFDVWIDAGLGQMTIVVPEEVGVRVQKDGGLVMVNYPGSYRVSGDTYTSPNYASAEHQIDLDIELGECSIYGGVSWSRIKGDETAKEFRDRAQEAMDEVFGKNEYKAEYICDTVSTG